MRRRAGQDAGDDGYHGVQLGFGDCKPKHSTQPLIGHTAKAGVGPRRHFHEVSFKEATDKKPGDEVKVDIFDGVQFVDVIGTSKGKGTAGVMKRHHFGGQPASHGTERKHRSPVRWPAAPPGVARAASPRRASAWPATWALIPSPRGTTRW